MSAYGMTTHKVTQVTPNLAMLGREVLLPATLIVKPPEEPVDTTVPFVNDLRDHIRAAHAHVRQTTLQAAKTQKTYYDNRSLGLKFAIGQKVWLYWRVLHAASGIEHCSKSGPAHGLYLPLRVMW